MAAVGSLTIHAWRGTPQGERKPVEIVTRAGVAGTGLVVGAAQATPYTVETDYYSTADNCETWRDMALGYVGTAISVTDALGSAWSDTVVLDVKVSIIAVKGLGSSTHLLRATWTFASEV